MLDTDVFARTSPEHKLRLVTALQAHGLTVAMNTLVVMEVFHLFFIRNMYGTSLTWQAVCGTKVVWGAVITVPVGQFLVTYAPFLQAVFATEAVALTDGLIIVCIGVALFTIIEIEKQIRLRRSPSANF